MTATRVWPHRPEGPALTEAEIRDAGPQEVVDMLDTAKRAAEVAVKAEAAGSTNNARAVRRNTLEMARECAQRALLVLDIALNAEPPAAASGGA